MATGHGCCEALHSDACQGLDPTELALASILLQQPGGAAECPEQLAADSLQLEEEPCGLGVLHNLLPGIETPAGPSLGLPSLATAVGIAAGVARSTSPAGTPRKV